jgi:Tfp pilus assembly protein PilF
VNAILTSIRGFVVVVLVLIGVALTVPTVVRAAVQNIVFVGVRNQALSGLGYGAALGLRTFDLDASDATDLGSDMWAGLGAPLGLAPIFGEGLLAGFGDCDARRVLARRRMRDGELAAARAELEATVLECPRYSVAQLELAVVYDRLRRPDLAVETLEANGLARAAPQLAAADYLELIASCAPTPVADSHDQCVRWLSRAQELVPRHVLPRVHLAKMLGTPLPADSLAPHNIRLTWSDERLDALTVSGYIEWAAVQPVVAFDVLLAVGRQLARERDVARAMTLYQGMNTLYPQEPQVAYLAGLAAGSIDDWPQAERQFRRAIALSPDVPIYLAALSRARLHNGDREAALATYWHLTEFSPCIPEAVAFLATTIAEHGTDPPSDAQQRQRCQTELTRIFEAEATTGLDSAVVVDPAASGALARAGHGGTLLYGPYLSLPPGRYRATFRLKTIHRLKTRCLWLDVSAETDDRDGVWLVQLPLRSVPTEALPEGRYADQELTFQSTGGGRFEFRVRETCGQDVLVDWVGVEPIFEEFARDRRSA